MQCKYAAEHQLPQALQPQHSSPQAAAAALSCDAIRAQKQGSRRRMLSPAQGPFPDFVLPQIPKVCLQVHRKRRSLLCGLWNEELSGIQAWNTSQLSIDQRYAQGVKEPQESKTPAY